MSEMAPINLREANIWADKHRVRRCDASTGHSVQTIALCENSTVAALIADALVEKAKSCT